MLLAASLIVFDFYKWFLFENGRGLLIAGQDQGRNATRSMMKEMFSWYGIFSFKTNVNVYFLLSYTLLECLTVLAGISVSLYDVVVKRVCLDIDA